MALITSIYKDINQKHQEMINENQEHIENMLDYAISELVEIAVNNEIYLVDDMKLCETYEEIFDCLKHRSQKRKNDKK